MPQSGVQEPQDHLRHRGSSDRVVVPLTSTQGIVLYVDEPGADEQVRGLIVADTSDAQRVAERLRDVTEVNARLSRIGDRLEVGLEQVLQALEEITSSIPAGAGNPEAQLSEHEQATLREAGLLQDRGAPAPGRGPAPAAVRYAQMLARGLTVKETAVRLRVSEGRVRQRLAERSVYGFQTKQGWRVPPFQLTDHGTLPGLELVLRALPDKLHPLSVDGFFNRPSADLDTDDGPVSAADWLAAGEDPNVVVELARDLLVTA